MSWMSRHKRPLILCAIATGLLISSFVFALTASSYTSGFATLPFYFMAIIWTITILSSIVFLFRKSLRTFFTIFGLTIIGIPFAWLFSLPFQNSVPHISVLVFFFTIAAWSLISALISRSVKGIYWSLHFAAWLVGCGIAAALSVSNTFLWPFPALLWLLLPIGISLVLFAQYKTFTESLSVNPFFRDRRPQPQFPPHHQPTQPPYEQGYQPVQPTIKAAYEEGGKLHPYPEQATSERAKAQYPQQMIQS